MLLHLPIAIAALVSPITVSDTAPPAFDIARECRLEGESIEAPDRCSKDEADALRQLQAEWMEFVAADKTTCLGTMVGSFASYVELLTCLENARDVRGEEKIPRGPVTNRKLQSSR
ncbi:hypothetical protein [Bradyrhizobium sp. CER78]|uniref:hypothetical protein n=1 Tax=Bradyrhizobium sp. CER78 TaxID=3039162 RepID=UPI00244B1CEF|nr:hypothetical protein [Bradyrhizobium sp. CER78]MDH2384968.1 hypothetical protein [Bradyrhizobium sp. CER78]